MSCAPSNRFCPCCGGLFHLIGYCYGGVVALSLALANPMPVQTITLIEPVFFSALRYAAADASYARFEEEGRRFRENLDAGYPATAMRDFVNFWCGKDAWEQRLSGGARSAMIGAVQKVALDWQAAFAFDPGPQRLEKLAGREWPSNRCAMRMSTSVSISNVEAERRVLRERQMDLHPGGLLQTSAHIDHAKRGWAVLTKASAATKRPPRTWR
jgi:pimeloyl-ACP methyl ester carboxylesterase